MSSVRSEIDALAARAAADRADFDQDRCDHEQAMAFLREGAGQAIWIYIDGRTGDRLTPFSEADVRTLERAMNTWFELWARCEGVEVEANFSIRSAAEVLLETHNIRETASLLTTIPIRPSDANTSR